MKNADLIKSEAKEILAKLFKGKTVMFEALETAAFDAFASENNLNNLVEHRRSEYDGLCHVDELSNADTRNYVRHDRDSKKLEFAAGIVGVDARELDRAFRLIQEWYELTEWKICYDYKA
jgi:hypothetical protein